MSCYETSALTALSKLGENESSFSWYIWISYTQTNRSKNYNHQVTEIFKRHLVINKITLQKIIVTIIKI